LKKEEEATSGQLPNPVFVVGVFRSGTSLLYALLNQHPQIALMYECDVWNFPRLVGRRRFSGDWLQRQEFYNQALSRHRLIFGGKMRGLEGIRTPEDLYRVHGDSKEALLWGEKSPVYATRLAQLAHHYPRGSFILIWRDPVEVYRSILAAGKKLRFFRRPGMLPLLIYYKERMIREAGQLQRAGARIHHVNYDDLVDRTEATCRSLCGFLGVDFGEEMLKLERADFSAIHRHPPHEFLRRGIIERQKYEEQAVAPARAASLRRYRNRWERLSGRRLSLVPPPGAGGEPFLTERLCHGVAGAFFFGADSLKRLMFEFFPLTWLQTYRLFKSWLCARDHVANRLSIRDQIRQHGITLFTCFLLWAVIMGMDRLAGPEISLGPLYLIPCGILALVVGRGWASIFAVFNALAITFLRMNENRGAGHLNFSMDAVLIWNIFMRFVLFEIFVLLLDRIRIEFTARNGAANAAAAKSESGA
jgi:Sulfotransferase family